MYLGKADSQSNKAYVESAAREALLKVSGIAEVLHVELTKVTDFEETPNYYVLAKYKTLNNQIITSEFSFNV